MKKEEVRKEYFKLRIKGHSQNQCRKILLSKFGFEVSKRTLQRWTKKLNETGWDLKDESKRPKTIHKKILLRHELKILELRNKTGWGERMIENFVDLSHTSVNKVLRKNKLIHLNPRRKKRIKYIRWQRKNPNSLWQVDHSDQKIEGKWCLSIIDDCSRYSLGLFDLNNVTTKIVTQILDELGRVHGFPREILTDNGSAYGLKSKHSRFDRWCNRRGIRHIRSAVHSPTTCGKVERLFQTMKNEMKFCRDVEHFRMRYNHFRPHTSLERKSPAEVYFKG